MFSSLHRLGKEFNLITPIDVIELRILEMSVQRCCTEVKKSASSKDHQSDMENSRELMKLIDNFVSNFPNKATERLVSSKLIAQSRCTLYNSYFKQIRSRYWTR